jgi:hypothetical protein
LNAINEHGKSLNDSLQTQEVMLKNTISLNESIENICSNISITNCCLQEIKDHLPDKATISQDINQISAIVSQLSKSMINSHNNSKIWQSNMKTMIDPLNKLPLVLDSQTEQQKHCNKSS